MTENSEALRKTMRQWTTGVCIVCSKNEAITHGMTVNSFTSISLDPPLISVALKQLTHTHEFIQKSGEFAITILASNQGELSDRFAGKMPGIADRFEGIETERLVIDAPLLKGGIAYLNCRVKHTINAGENTLFIAEVIAARGVGDGDPLVYHNRVFWKLAK